MRLVLAQINPTVGDLEGNSKKIIDAIASGRETGAGLVVFPELAVSGYPPEDLLLLPHFLDAVEEKIRLLIEACQGVSALIGFPRRNREKGEKKLYNSVAVIDDGELLGYYDKALLPTYDVFDERRYFDAGAHFPIWEIRGKKVAVTICEDIWQHSELLSGTCYAIDPILEYAPQRPDLLINISASPFSGGKLSLRLEACASAARKVECPVVFCNQTGGNDGLIFDGYSFLLNKDGKLLQKGKGFKEDLLAVEPFQPKKNVVPTVDPIGDTFQALVLGVRDYFHKSGFQKACLGLSGGIDSAVVACVAKQALGKKNLLTVIMPSQYSSKESMRDAHELAARLGVRAISIPIESPFDVMRTLLEPHFEGKGFDVAEENLQARIRGMALMALSNKHGYIVLSTGNKSEMAMGYATLYGDMCGGLGVLGDVTKMHVYDLARWINKEREIIPRGILERVPSAELRPGQKDSDSLPEYSVIDHVVREYVEEHRAPSEIVSLHHYDPEVVEKIVRAIHASEYKRQQSPPLLRVSKKAFSAGRKFPIVQRWVS